MMESKFINSYSHDPLTTSAFLCYMITSLTCLIVYSIFFVKVFRVESSEKRCCCDPLMFGAKTLLVLVMPFVANGFQLIDSIIGTIGYFLGRDV